MSAAALSAPGMFQQRFENWGLRIQEAFRVFRV